MNASDAKVKKFHMESIIISGISLCVVICSLFFLYFYCGSYYETNDDRILTEFVSGVLTGSPDGNAIYINYVLGQILAWLYSITKEIPWYGIFMFGSHALCYFTVISGLLLHCKTWKSRIFAWLAGTAFLFCNLASFVQMQFTSTAGMLGMVGYFWLLADRDSKIRKYLVFAFFEFLSLQLRTQAMEMVQPIGMLVLVAFYILPVLNKEKKWKEFWSALLIPIGIVLSCLLICFVTNFLGGGYGTEAWKAYTAYNDASLRVFDYSFISDPGEIHHILTKYGVSDTEFTAFHKYWMLGNPISTECLQEIYEYVKPIYAADFSFSEIMQTLLRMRFSGDNYNYGRYTVLAYALATFLIICSRKWKQFIPLATINLGRLVILLYLLYNGRLPFRVLSILYIGELIFLLILAFSLIKEVDWKKWKQILLMIYLVGSTYVLIKGSLFALTDLGDKNEVKAGMKGGLEQIYEYCETHPGKYIIDNMSSYWYVSDIFTTSWYDSRNLLVSGAWYSFAPNVVAHEKEYLAREGDTYLLLTMYVGTIEEHYAYDYFVNEKGCELEYHETIPLVTGGELAVYRLIGDYPYEEFE